MHLAQFAYGLGPRKTANLSDRHVDMFRLYEHTIRTRK